MSVVATNTCICGHITAEVIQCPSHYHLFKGGKRLTSVGRIVEHYVKPLCPKCGVTGWNHKPDCPIGAAIENAKQRGRHVDRVFSEYVRTGEIGRQEIRSDARGLILRLVRWFDQQNFWEVRSQVVLGADDYGGVVDLVLNGVPVDIKATYKVEPTARLQVAGYADLMKTGTAAIIHVTERFSEPKWVDLEPENHADWLLLVESWRVARKYGAPELYGDED